MLKMINNEIVNILKFEITHLPSLDVSALGPSLKTLEWIRCYGTPLCSTDIASKLVFTNILRGVLIGFVTGCPCGVRGRGLTTLYFPFP